MTARMPVTHEERVAWFVVNACPDHHIRGGPAHVRAIHTAGRILARYPEVANAGIFTAVVTGDIDAVRRAIAANPVAAKETCGPKGKLGLHQDSAVPDWSATDTPTWTPLLYLCFTRLANPATNDNAVEIARLLLDAGADPNAYFMAGDSLYTPLVGAIGEGEEHRLPHPRRDELVDLLLERGANPYDIQVLYNIHFHGELLWYLKRAHAAAKERGRESDWDDPDWRMLDMGGYGSGARYVLGIAVANNDVELAEWSLAHGASANPPAPPGTRWWRAPKRSLHEDAIARGHTAVAALLERHGAKVTAFAPKGAEALLAACVRGDEREARAIAKDDPKAVGSHLPMHEAARLDHVDAVKLLLSLGASVESVNPKPGEPALHTAAYHDATKVIALLLSRGARVDVFSTLHGATAIWYALWDQRRDAIELLSRVTHDVWSLVHLGKVERLRELLAADPSLAGVGVDHRDVPLHYLAVDEPTCLAMAKLLVENGADPNVRGQEGAWTPIELAEVRCMPDLAAYLKSVGERAS